MAGGFGEIGEPKDSADQAKVEQDRRRRGGGEPAQGVQDPGHQRDQGNKQQIRKCDPGQLHSQVELGRVAYETRREAQHHQRHGQLNNRHENQQGPEKNAEGSLGERLGRLDPIRFDTAREHRHEGHRERALGEQAAEQVGELKGDEKDIGAGAGAEHGGNQDIAQEAQDPADQGKAANGGDGTQKHHGRLNKGFLWRRKGS